jgi:hypothetical protein
MLIAINYFVLFIGQVQGVCDNRGNVIWYSGPHLGVTSDIKLFRENSPPLLDGELLLGDKAYQGLRGRVLVPYKKKKVPQASPRAATRTTWFTAGTEQRSSIASRS